MVSLNHPVENSLPQIPPSNLAPHNSHIDCCITDGFRTVVDESSAAVIVVEEQGFLIFANPAAEELFGYPREELLQKHIFAIVHADSSWVASEFAYLIQQKIWSGTVQIERSAGDTTQVTVNAHSSPVAGFAEHIAFLRPTDIPGPAIERVPAFDPSMTARELRLLQLIGEGLDNSQIATVLGMSDAEAAAETRDVLRKMCVLSRTEAFVVAKRERLIV